MKEHVDFVSPTFWQNSSKIYVAVLSKSLEMNNNMKDVSLVQRKEQVWMIDEAYILYNALLYLSSGCSAVPSVPGGGVCEPGVLWRECEVWGRPSLLPQSPPLRRCHCCAAVAAGVSTQIIISVSPLLHELLTKTSPVCEEENCVLLLPDVKYGDSQSLVNCIIGLES